MTETPSRFRVYRIASRIDAWLMRVSLWPRAGIIILTLAAIVYQSLPNVPRAAVDYSRIPILSGVTQPAEFGTDTIADRYEAKVILNDVRDMYTKTRLDQTPLEAATWTKAASSPYPPAMLLSLAVLHVAGEALGVGLYGAVLILAALFLALSLWYFLQTRWYLFPLLYLDFSYFAERFVYVQDGSYLVMLNVIMAALLLARRRPTWSHALVAVATTMKLSPLYYAKNVVAMPVRSRVMFIGILAVGFVLPYFIWENYLYIFSYNNELKGDTASAIGALALAAPLAVVLGYVEAKREFDTEARIGWGLVPVAVFLAFKMNAARHLFLVLLVPDRHGARNVAAGLGLAAHYVMPGVVGVNAVLPLTTVLLVAALVRHLELIGWSRVRADARHPWRALVGSADRP